MRLQFANVRNINAVAIPVTIFNYTLANLCPALEDPQFGSVEIMSNSVFRLALYTCDTGYEVVGVRQRTCLSSGMWSDRAPSCQCGCLNLNCS